MERTYRNIHVISRNALLEACLLYRGIQVCYLVVIPRNTLLEKSLLYREIHTCYIREYIQTEYTMFLWYTNTNTINT